MRIALIASNQFPIRQPFAGGLEAHVWHLARALVQAGHRVSLFAGPDSDPGLDCPALEVQSLGLSAAALSDSSMPSAVFMADHHAYLTLMLQLAGSAGKEFDVIHNHSLHHLPVAMAPTLSTPMLCTLHTPPTPWLESALGATAGAGAQFAAVSAFTARSWQHLLSDIALVRNGIDCRYWPVGSGGDDLVWFGRITREKAPHLAIAAARLARRQLILAGPISDVDYFVHDVQPHLGGNVRYAGHLAHAELAQLVGNSAAALVTPQWDEPYGLVVAEAMMCGTPVIAFARGGIPEIVGTQGGRLVPDGDVNGMAAAIGHALTLPRSAVHAQAASHCSAASMVDRYLNLYRTMIENSGQVNVPAQAT
ncbi:glycosyltransferase [Mycobacterium sp. 236(2023)]|uniref:glycosyltransferase n=1 Tax=Mycobacterium sp. 236(2023) TaxID=3038163 RepID=UPI0024157855|nr:glycosyltransferase [Mycobacterium sp. 236(2023)]MDG4664387.1 glycosyltransferase [Mycobacterium sp. 236(2023)]